MLNSDGAIKLKYNDWELPGVPENRKRSSHLDPETCTLGIRLLMLKPKLALIDLRSSVVPSLQFFLRNESEDLGQCSGIQLSLRVK